MTDEEEAVTTTTTTTAETSSASQSPREVAERCKSPAESSEVDLDSLSEQKADSVDVESSEMAAASASPAKLRGGHSGLKRKAPPSDVGSRSPMHGGKRKRRVRDATGGGRGRGGRGRHGSDRLVVKGDDDFDDDDHHHKNAVNLPMLGTLDNDALLALTQRSPNSKKYNFFVDLGKCVFSMLKCRLAYGT
jgi:hypothetical protein